MYYMHCANYSHTLPVSLQAVVVHETVREGDNVRVHPVLRVEHAHRVGELWVLQELVDSLEQRLTESQLLSFLIKHDKRN